MSRTRQITRGRLHLEHLENRQLMAADFLDYADAVATTLPRIDISAQEQLVLEMINRARANPTAEAQRLGIDLNQGLSATAISSTAKPPLAPHQALNNAATAHTREMLQNNFFDHAGLNGSTPYDRARSAGYANGAAENIAYRSYWNGKLDQAVAATHDMLFLSPGHRQNLMNDAMRDFGIGIATGERTFSNGNAPVVMTTENFGRTNTSQRSVTGVVYTDQVVDDDFYTVGEGLANITIIAQHVTSLRTFATVTGTSGGYALQLEPGRYTLRAFNQATHEVAELGQVEVANVNLKVDITPEQFQASPIGPVSPISPINPEPTVPENGRFDCNQDGIVSARDVLSVINYVNNPQPNFDPSIDINADSHVTPLDVLWLVNFINAREDQARVPNNLGESTPSTPNDAIETVDSDDPRLVQLTNEALQIVDGWYKGQIKAEAVSVKTVQWSNTGLGLAGNNTQSITPGYQIIIRAGANLYEYRAAMTGSLRYAGMTRANDYLTTDRNRVCCPWALDADCLVAIDKAIEALTANALGG